MPSEIHDCCNRIINVCVNNNFGLDVTFKARTVKFIIIAKSVKVMTCCEGSKTIYGEKQIRIKTGLL